MSELAPFNIKQLAYLQRCKTSWLNVLEGGKRGSKNVLQATAFSLLLEQHPDRIHLVAGVSVATAKLNILDCDGFGLLRRFAGRYREGKYKDRDCLYIQTRTGEKIVLISGGGKSGDEKLIKGNTYGMAMITEANECHQDFLQEVMDRTLSSSDRKIFHDLNPKAPKHRYYVDFLDFHEKQQKKEPSYGYNYGHTTIADNMSISDEKLHKVLKTYDKGTVWYLRDILGQRKQAEGAIYRSFADNPEKYLTDKPDYDFIQIGVDFGGNKSSHAFVATGLKYDYSKLTALMSEKHNAEGMTPEDLYKAIAEFEQRVRVKYGDADILYADSAEQTLINGMRDRLNIPVVNSIKNPVIDRIRATTSLMASGRFFYTEDCETLKDALQGAVYDEKCMEDKRLDDFTSDIDTLDAFEYSWERYIKGYAGE